MTVKTGISSNTPDRIIIDAGAVYLNYGLGSERLLGATRGGNEFNLNRTSRNIEIDGLKGAVKGLKRIVEVNPQITANLLELSVENLIAAIGGANQSDRGYINLEHISGAVETEFDLNQNDIIENSEKVYVKDSDGVGTLVEQTRSKKYASRFVGDNALDNKGFDAGYGNWQNDQGKASALSLVTGGLSGNCLKFTGETDVTAVFLTLPGGDGGQLTNLVVGEHYRLQIAVKGDAGWGGGAITVKCAGTKTGEEMTVADPADTDWIVYVIVFEATGTDATITLEAASAPTLATDIVQIDSLELEKVDYQESGDIAATGQFGYVMKLDGGTGKKGSIVFMNALTADDEIVINYTYAKSSPDHTTITGGEIGDSDYIDNVAIVGNVSGKSKPVICMVKNALADTGFSLSTAPRDEAVPAIVFTGHYDPDDLDTEPWEIRWPNS